MKNAYLQEISDWNIPLRELDNSLNPFANLNVKIWVLCGFQTPHYVTLKAGMVYHMLADAKATGKLDGIITHIVEASSGATILCLATLAPDNSFGIPHVKIIAVMNDNVPDGKRLPVKYAGAEVIGPHAGMSTIATARKLGEQPGWLNLDQYANMANPLAYQHILAPQIITKFSERRIWEIGLFASPVGTGGTLIGLSEGFKKRNFVRETTGAMCMPKQSIPGMRSKEQMSEIRLPWQKAGDTFFEIEERLAYLAAFQIEEHTGMMMGISSGATYLALLQALKKHELDGSLDNLRNGNGSVDTALIAHDGLRTYTANKNPWFDGFRFGMPKVWTSLPGF